MLKITITEYDPTHPARQEETILAVFETQPVGPARTWVEVTPDADAPDLDMRDPIFNMSDDGLLAQIAEVIRS